MRAVRYRASPIESQAGLRAGERLTVADLLRALLVASANDAAATLAERVGGSRAAFVRLMNRRARALGLRDTHFANPIGLDAGGQPLLRVGPRQARADPAPRPVPARGDRPPARDADQRRAPPDARQPQPARAQRPRGQRREDRPHAAGGLRARGLGHARRRDRRQRRPRRSERVGPRRRHARAAALRPGALPALDAGARRPARCHGAAAPPRVRARRPGGDAHRDRAPSGAASRRRSASSGRPRSSTARCPRGRGWARSRSAGAGARSTAWRS